jgi:hypothetical protein
MGDLAILYGILLFRVLNVHRKYNSSNITIKNESIHVVINAGINNIKAAKCLIKYIIVKIIFS